MEEEKPVFDPQIYVKIYGENYVDRLTEAFKGNVDTMEKAIALVKTPEAAADVLGKLERLIGDLERNKVVGDYLGMRHSKEFNVRGALKVQYKRYANLREALGDFREQLNMPRGELSRVSRVSTRICTLFESGNLRIIKSPAAKKKQDSAIERYISVFDISPSEGRDELLKLFAQTESYEPASNKKVWYVQRRKRKNTHSHEYYAKHPERDPNTNQNNIPPSTELELEEGEK